MNYNQRFDPNKNPFFGSAEVVVDGEKPVIGSERLQSIGNKVQGVGEAGAISSGEESGSFAPDEIVGNMDEETPVTMEMPPGYAPEMPKMPERQVETVPELIGGDGEVAGLAVQYAKETAKMPDDDPHAMMEKILNLTDGKAG